MKYKSSFQFRRDLKADHGAKVNGEVEIKRIRVNLGPVNGVKGGVIGARSQSVKSELRTEIVQLVL